MGLVIQGGGSSTAYTSPSGYRSLLAPYNPSFIQTVGANNGNFILGTRVIAAMSGTLHDLSVYIGTSSGNLRVGIYDTDDALAGSRSLLYGSGSVASPGTGMQIIADPALAITAGKQYDLVVFPDNNTITLGRFAQVGAAANTLPAGFIAATGGASPKINWAFSLAYAALPGTITEANCGAASAAYWVGGRIT